MSFTPSNVFTSKEGLQSTILTDKFVFRWFCYLIEQPPIKTIIFSDHQINLVYQRFKKFMFGQWAMGMLLISLVIMFWRQPHFIFLLFFIVAFWALIKLRFWAKECMSVIGFFLIEQQYPKESFKQETFFMICEHLAQKAGIFSLIDAIYTLDKAHRFTVIFSIILIGYIVGIETWWLRYVYIFGIYNLVYFLSQTNFFYKNIR